MSKCDTCKNNTICKVEEQRAFQMFEKMGAVDCSGYEYEKPKTEEELRKEFMARFISAADVNEDECEHWIITERGCVITCPKCGERLELCYPDGTEVRYLPHCPWCGKRLENKE